MEGKNNKQEKIATKLKIKKVLKNKLWLKPLLLA
jgi:hypothetical protein